ncbi:MAG: class I SAM-dependent methyltransferase [Thermodesulfobacteriota bacterium]
MKDTYAIFKGKLFVLEAFNHFAFRHVTAEILRILKEQSCSSVLEVCCGTGKLSEVITAAGMRVTGVDMSETMLERAREKARAPELILMDALEMDFDREFDAAIIQIALHEMTKEVREKVLSKMKRAVKRGGVVIVADFVVNKSRSINAKISGYFVEKGERKFLDTHPEHFYNYEEFMNGGGASAFLGDEEILSKAYFLGGHVGVVAIAT